MNTKPTAILVLSHLPTVPVPVDLVALGIFLEEEFGSKVDIVSKRAVRNELKSRIFSEVVYAHS